MQFKQLALAASLLATGLAAQAQTEIQWWHSMTAAIAAFRSGNAPHILQVFEVGTATMMAAKGAIVPVGKVLADPKYGVSIRGMGYVLPAAHPAEFTKVLTDERNAWTERVRLTGFTAAD